MVATPIPLHLALEVSTLDKRGWILQEQLLSRRCLYFTSRYVCFQCGREILKECGVNQPMRTKPEERSNRVRSINFAPPTIIDNPLLNLQELAEFGPMKRQFKAFAAYAKLVKKYTLRKLSYESDVLNAFSGLFAILNEYFESDIIIGLPTSAFDLALLWAPATIIPRRGCKLPTMETLKLGQVDRSFPSWSWAGWTGPIEYRFFTESKWAEEPLPTPLAESYILQANGKLQTIPARVSVKERLPNSAPGTSENPASDHSANTPPAPLPSPTAILPPTLLQLFAPYVPLTAFTISPTRDYISSQEHIHSNSRQSVRHILDRHGKRCGLWWEQAGYVYVGRDMSPNAESKMLLIGISQHGDTYRAREGPSRVEGTIRLFDEDAYSSVGKGSGLVNVLAIDLDMPDHEYAERITVARIHIKAWEEAGPWTRWVQLI